MKKKYIPLILAAFITVIAGCVLLVLFVIVFSGKSAGELFSKKDEVTSESISIDLLDASAEMEPVSYPVDWPSEFRLPNEYTSNLFLEPYATDHSSIVYHSRFTIGQPQNEVIETISKFLEANEWEIIAADYAYENVYVILGQRNESKDSVIVIIQSEKKGIVIIQFSAELYKGE